MEKMLHDRKVIVLFLLPSLLVFSFTVMLPILWSVYYSFFHWNGVTPKRFIGLLNYTRLFGDIYFREAFVNNLVYVLVNLFGQVFIGMLVALLLTSIRRGRNFFKTLYFAPTILSTVAVAQMFVKFYSYNPPGVVNSLLEIVGLGQLKTAWLGSTSTALIAVAIVECYKNMGLYMVIIYAGLISIPQDVIEAAMIDGASSAKVFRHIKLPYLKGVLGVSLVMAVNGLLKAFDIPYITTGGGPGSASELLTTYMYKTAFNSARYGYGSTIAVFVVVECVLAVSVLRALINRKEA